MARKKTLYRSSLTKYCSENSYRTIIYFIADNSGNSLARSLSAHITIEPLIVSDKIHARSFTLLTHRLPSSQPLVCISAQLYRASPFFHHTKTILELNTDA